MGKCTVCGTCSVIMFFCSSAVAMKAMNKVASHINEMQKIHEEFGAVFDQLITEQSGEKKEVGWTKVTWLYSFK